MSIIYGTPLFFSGGTTILSSLPPLLDNFKAVSQPIVDSPSQVKITLSANKLPPEMATDLAGAVWVYGDHQPDTANDGRRIELQKDAIVGDNQSIVEQTFTWNTDKDFYVRQFTYNDKKQYQTMMYGATAMIRFVGVPQPVTDLQETHSGSSINLTWKNPVEDKNFHHVIVAYGLSGFPATPEEGTSVYNSTGETAKIEKVTLGATYYISVFTISTEGLYGNPVQATVEIPEGKLLSSLPSGTKIKLGRYGGKDLQWKLARDTSNQKIRMILNASSMDTIGGKMFDNKEPSNKNNRDIAGNNRYIWSNLHQWLNSDKPANQWYAAQHQYDAPPDYTNINGFLYEWNESERNVLDSTNWIVTRHSADGGGSEVFQSRVTLPSTTEMGLNVDTGGGRLDIFNNDTDRKARLAYWCRTPHTGLAYNVMVVYNTGAEGASGGANNPNLLVRPMCAPKPETLVSLELDDDGCYTVVA